MAVAKLGRQGMVAGQPRKSAGWTRSRVRRLYLYLRQNRPMALSGQIWASWDSPAVEPSLVALAAAWQRPRDWGKHMKKPASLASIARLWLVGCLALMAVRADAQSLRPLDWVGLSGRPLLRSQDALKFTDIEIDKMNAAEVDAFAQVLAACRPGFVTSKNEMIIYECERSAEYFEVVSVNASTIINMLKVLRLQWSIWGRLSGPARGHGNNITRFVDISSNWKGSLHLRLMKSKGCSRVSNRLTSQASPSPLAPARPSPA
jgi:hypothetical protein